MTKISDSTKRAYNEGMAERLKLFLSMFLNMTKENEIGTTDLKLLKETKENLRERIGVHAAIGIMSPNNYDLKQVDGEAKLARISAIINLIEVFVETQTKMTDVRKKQNRDSKFMSQLDNIL